MRRRLDLAMTLVGDPRIIFLDEPTAGLDPRSRRVMWDIIRDLVASGVTIFLTTQYLEEADRLAHRIAVLDRGTDGRRRDAGRAQAPRAGRAHPARVHRRRRARSGPPAIFADGSRDDEALTLQVPSDGGTSARCATLLDRLDAESIDVGGLSVQTPDLDDVFLSLTGDHDNEKATAR